MKFDDNCLRRVIRELQRLRGVELTKIGAARKYLVDDKGVRYLVLGGVEHRHEIPRAIFEEEARAAGESLLVVALPGRNELDIFVGPFRPLLEHGDRLPADHDHYVFHVHRFTNRLIVREIPFLELTRVTLQTPEEEMRAARKALEKLKRNQAIAVARTRRSNAVKEAATRGGRAVVAVEGNLIRADFRKGKSK